MGNSLSNLWVIWTQYFPPKPTLTGKNLPSLAGKVFIVTGATSGIGYELTKLLYAAGGTVYLFNRDEARTTKIIDEITNSPSTSTPGSLHFIQVDLADLANIAPAVAKFRKASSRLDVLFNNAGIGSAPYSLKTAQGLDPHYGTNVAAPHLLTKLLLPVLASTAKISPPGSVRVIWNGSLCIELLAPKGGVRIDQLRNPGRDRNEHYSASRAANWFMAYEWDRRFCRSEGIVNLVQNPGNLQTSVWRTTPGIYYYPFAPFLYEAVNGAYTNLWAAFDQSITVSDGGRYVMPFGRWHPGQRSDVVLALKSKEEGGTGQAGQVWDWCEEVTQPFLPHE